MRIAIGVLVGCIVGVWIAGRIAVRQDDGWALLGPAWIFGGLLGALIGGGIGATLR